MKNVDERVKRRTIADILLEIDLLPGKMIKFR